MIRLLKLVSGESIISEIEELDDKIKLIKPAIFIATPKGTGIAEYLNMFKNDDCVIPKTHIMFGLDLEPDKNIAEAYDKHLMELIKRNAGIITPNMNQLRKFTK